VVHFEAFLTQYLLAVLWPPNRLERDARIGIRRYKYMGILTTNYDKVIGKREIDGLFGYFSNTIY